MTLPHTTTIASTKKPWVVQKFGGTSVGKFPMAIVNDIIKDYAQDYQVAVVCSARSTDVKSEGTTSRLVSAASKALEHESFEGIIGDIRESHLAAARSHITGSATILDHLETAVNHECDSVASIISAARVIDEVSSRTMDAIISAGEKLSCLYMAALISDNGLPAKYVDLSHVVPSSYVASPQNGNALDKEFYRYLVDQIRKEVEACNGAIPVITGFFGAVPGGLLESVGRGYTDLCAALTAVAVKADELQIWKEVDGIFTADPRKVPTARLIPIITPDEAAELTYYGSEVIHPFTMEQVMNAHIPICLKNVMNPQGQGTMVYPERDTTGTPTHRMTRTENQTSSASSSGFFEISSKSGPTAVTTKSNIIVLNVNSNRRDLSHGFLAHVFSILNKWMLVVDLISTSEVRVSMALQTTFSEDHFKNAMAELRKYGTVDVIRKLCIVSLVGTQMKQSIGTAGSMFSALADAGVNIEMISQGASEINISAVIEQKDTLKALNVLHHRLLCRPRTPSLLNLHELHH